MSDLKVGDRVIQASVEEFPDELKNLIVGQRVVDIRGGDSLVLSSGVVLEIDTFGDCCAGADFDFVDFEKLIRSGNVITNIDVVWDDEWGDCAQIFILTEAGMEGSVDLSWSEGSGYYSYGYTITVKNVHVIESKDRNAETAGRIAAEIVEYFGAPDNLPGVTMIVERGLND